MQSIIDSFTRLRKNYSDTQAYGDSKEALIYLMESETSIECLLKAVMESKENKEST